MRVAKVLVAALLWPLISLAQTFTYPSVTFQNVTVLGTLYGASFNLGPQAANTVLANATSSSAVPTPFAMPGCSSSASALQWVSGSGFACNSAITANALTAGAWASPGAIGSTTPNSGSFTNLNVSGSVSGAGFAGLLGGYSGNASITPPVTLTTSSLGAVLSSSASGAITLPLTSAAASGTAIHFMGRAWGSVIFPQGSDTLFPPYGSSSAMQLNTTDEATMVSNGAGGWVVTNIKHAHCANILDFGGNNTAGANNDSAFASAVNSQGSSSQVCVYLPAGYYNFASSVTYNRNGTTITVEGDGPETSLLKFPASTGGFIFQTSSGSMNVNVRNLTILANGAGGGTSAIFFDNTNTSGGPQPQVPSVVENVSIRGADGYNATDYWSYGVGIESWSQFNFNNLYVGGGSSNSGIGVNLSSANPPNGIVYNFVNCTFNFLATGIVYGNDIQGVAVSNTNFNSNTGISVPSGESGLDQLVVSNSQFGINVGTGINIQSLLPNTQIVGNLFIIPGTSNGIVLNNTGLFSIVGNSFNEGSGATGINGITVGNTNNNYPGIITGNIFDGMVGGSGIALFSTSNHVNVQSNVYSGNGTNVSNAGTTNTVGGGSQ